MHSIELFYSIFSLVVAEKIISWHKQSKREFNEKFSFLPMYECLECEMKCERDDPVSVHSTTLYNKFKWEIVNTDKPTNQQQQQEQN